MHKESKIFIAGHKGLVGSAIMRELLAQNYYNLVFKTRLELDLCNQEAVSDFFAQEKIEFVFLAAAKVGGIGANNTYRADFLYENLQIQNNVIHQAYKHGVKKLLFLGSTCIYPKNAPLPIKENALLTSELEYTNEAYAIAKIAGLKMCENYNLQYHTNFISVMPTNLYGVNDNFDLEHCHVLPALLRKIHFAKLLNENKNAQILKELAFSNIKSENIKLENYLAHFGIFKNRVGIWGSGKPRREFLHSDDLAAACVFLMQKLDFKDLYDKNEKEIKNTHINIGTQSDLSIKELAFLIKDIVGYKGSFFFDNSKPDGTMQKLTDCSKIHSLGWRAKIGIKEGIAELYEWYKKTYT